MERRRRGAYPLVMNKRADWILRSHRARVAVLVLIAVTSSLSVMADDQQNVVTLIQCIDAAMQNAPDIKLANATLAASQAQYSQAVAQNSLGLSATAGATRSQPVVNTVPSKYTGSTSPFSTTGVVANATDSAQAGVTLTQPSSPSTTVSVTGSYNLNEQALSDQRSALSLSASQTLWDGYLGGRGSAAVEQAGIALQIAQAADESTRKTIAYNVKQAYYTMLGQLQQIGVLQDTVKQRQEELKRIQTLFANENATRIDVEQAEVNESTAELDLSLAQSTLEVDREKLSNLVGWPADKVYSVSDVENPPVPNLDVNQAVQTAFGQRADLKQLKLTRSTDAIALALKKALQSPVVAATGGVSWDRDWTAGYDYADYSLGVQVNVPIFDSGLAESQIKQAQLQGQSDDIKIDQLTSNIAATVKGSVYTLKDLLARADLAQRNLALAQDQYNLAKAQFDAGVISALDLLTASVTLTTAQVGLAKAKNTSQLGVLALQNAMGE